MDEKLLIVEDDPLTLSTYRKVIEIGAPCRVFTAEKGAEALEIAQREKPDLILLDVNLPDMDGFELMERLQEEEGLQQAYVIFVSGSERRQKDKVKGLWLGGYEYLLKPVDPEELIARIKVAFRLKEGLQLQGAMQTVRTLQHEINNPLQVLLGTLELFERNIDSLNDRQRSQFERIKEASERISDVVRRISRVTRGHTIPSPAGDRLNLPRDKREP